MGTEINGQEISGHKNEWVQKLVGTEISGHMIASNNIYIYHQSDTKQMAVNFTFKKSFFAKILVGMGAFGV